MTEFDKVIPPGGVGKVTASLDTSHYKGALVKGVQVTTNAPTNGRVSLQLKADVVVAVDVTPSDSPMLRTTVGDAASTEVIVSAVDEKPFDVLTVEADPALAVTVRAAPGTQPARRPAKRTPARPVAAGSNRYLVTIASKGTAAVGNTRPTVRLATNHPKAETVSITPVLMVAGRVQVVPPQLFVRPGTDGTVAHATISKPTGGPLEILGVESNDPELTVTTTALEAGRRYDLVVRYGGQPGRGTVRSAITVKTNEPQQPTIVVPVGGRL